MKLSILIIEDDQKHLEDAKQAMKSHDQLAVDYATTYQEAKKLLAEKEYSGIISDIFFPYDAGGWSPVIRSKCYELLEYCGIKFYSYGEINQHIEEIIRAADEWMDGSSMHPSGVVIADLALERDIPLVFCTDTYHHGYKTEPINQWARENRISVVDCYSEKDSYTSQGLNKNWTEAFNKLTEHKKRMMEITCREDFVKILNKKGVKKLLKILSGGGLYIGDQTEGFDLLQHYLDKFHLESYNEQICGGITHGRCGELIELNRRRRKELFT